MAGIDIMAIVVTLWCQVVCVMVVVWCGCHLQCGTFHVNEKAGRSIVFAYLGWAQPVHCRCIVVGTRWWWWMGCIIDAGGHGKEEATTWQCLSHSCHIWEAMCQGGVHSALVYGITKPF